jgi:hypothetical protein
VKTIKRSVLCKWLIMQPKHDTDTWHSRISTLDYNLAGVKFTIGYHLGYYYSRNGSKHRTLEGAILDRLILDIAVIDDVSAGGES